MFELVRKLESRELGEKYTEYRHSSGLTVFIYPKNFTTAYAMLSARYGSLDRVFRTEGEAFATVPDGVAHFLEHKLFEEEDGTDVFEKFAALGANANAFTSFEMTSYLFSATDKIQESLAVLLSFVTHPHFTEENVEKEKGIIAQEIGMYDDRASSRLYYSLLEGLYKRHNVRVNIAGTVSSIGEITPEVLYRCYNTFYHPSNMILAICGRVTDEEVMQTVESVLGTAFDPSPAIERAFPEEPTEIAKAYTELSMEIAKPMFALGVKDLSLKLDSEEALRRAYAVNILLRLFFSRSSSYFNSLYAKGLIDDSFDSMLECMGSCAYLMVSGESERPEEAFEELESFLKNIPEDAVTEEDFLRVKRAMYAENIRILDSTESIAYEMTDAALHGYTVWDESEALRSVTYEDVCDAANNYFKDKSFARVLIRPIGAKGGEKA